VPELTLVEGEEDDQLDREELSIRLNSVRLPQRSADLVERSPPLQLVLAQNVEYDEAVERDRDGHKIDSFQVDLGKVHRVLLDA